jgi:hypothetical protein
MATYDVTWSTWCSTSSSTSTTYSTTADPFPNWCSDTSTTSSASTDVFYYWVKEPHSVSVSYTGRRTISNRTHKERHKEARKEKRREASRLRRNEKNRRKRLFKEWKKDNEERLSEQKALELFEDVFGKDVAKTYRETGRVLVKGRKYDWLLTSKTEKERNESGMFGGKVQVQRIEKDKIVDICVYTKTKVPPTDQIVSYALRAKFDEKNFLETGNDMGRKERDKKEQLCAVV